MDIEIKILNHEFYKEGCQFKAVPKGDFGLPAYATLGSAALDLMATRDVTLLPNCAQLIDTGLAMWIKDPNICAFILPRSGLGHKEGLVLGNLVGLIDSDYQGPLMVSLWNRSEFVREYTRGSRIAQMVFLPVVKPEVKVVQDFSNNTQRAVGGFGSTGV